MGKEKTVSLNLSATNTCLLLALLAVLIVSAYALFGMQKIISTTPEAPKTSQLTVTVVTPPDCEDCFDAATFAAAVQQLPLTNVTSEYAAHDSIKGQQLIKEYQLTRLPAAVVTGETENLAIPGFTKANNAYVYTETPPPYYDLSIGGVVGRVDVTFIVDPGCPSCFDIKQFGTQLNQAGVSTGREKTLNYNDAEARTLIEKYSIKTVPAMLMTKDALAYEIIAQAWPQVGTQEADGTLVLRNMTPPYRDLSTTLIRGFVTLTLLTDSTCAQCYNASLHRLVLEQSFGMKFKEEKIVDVSTPAGQTIANKYRVTLVPTMLLDKEAATYPLMAQAWPQVGTQEADGTFVFRNVDQLDGISYKNLSSKEIINSTRQG